MGAYSFINHWPSRGVLKYKVKTKSPYGGEKTPLKTTGSDEMKIEWAVSSAT